MTSSAEWFDRAVKVMPGGVNSPVRAFQAVGGTPPFIASASGPKMTTVDGTDLIDFIASWGALILGHAHPLIVESVIEATKKGTSFGAPTAAEVRIAELIVNIVPSVEVVRMVNSGTEATASAVRLARASTGKSGIIKFEGCYHGHADPFLVSAGSGAATLGHPSSPGVPPATVADTHVARFNDLESVEKLFAGSDIGCLIVEPVAGNMGVVPPAPGFLEGLRRLCTQNGAVLIFDEVMTGFRVGPSGAQGRYGVSPDLTCFGKVVAGGTPAAAYGGSSELMRMIAPDGPVYQAGTLAGNPLATAAGLACLEYLVEHPDTYDELERVGNHLELALATAVGESGCVQRVGSMLTVFFGPAEVSNWDDAAAVDRERFGRFFRSSYEAGVLVPPSPFESLFLMLDHGSVLDEATDILVDAVAASV